ncbi:MAG: hypothetical protein F4Y82_04490 [Cenarchaeum sp. SB0665_bin_23]|nr:hypothetical protein [Cenarchaeum sp. SB0667_bin_13]MXY37808.1 hypothetical protein [Cenarchaeum sp. SB0664_bin_35]MXY61353.1 hypothetical protein [Cenarchaeum sp. SB0665_bin_23]MXZ94072.1 hypothetical protein [Cenarchaeum sp. SB0666_bin_15]MYB46738.1 hypothetical protein [Cenarchaeum sp. SB0662_bin_33]MYC79665.1 hypothetical protein [Cenarchaeum sp. SB0661_bin_35]MYD58914.1 hypothetical protein [Cenarchaeum sp. SB0678_bin_8]MYG32717.1 hypothetical protein [Cenarchaeum sp. SB0677_bin_16]
MEKITVNQLHGIVLRESESDAILEIDNNMYQKIAESLSHLRKQAFDGMENEMRERLVETLSNLSGILLRIRLEKAFRSESVDTNNLVDEERYVLDAYEEQQERLALITAAASKGKTQLLRYVSEKYRSRMITVRLLKDMEALTGADYEHYGPFEAEDIATMPYVNARALMLQGSATRIRWMD